MIGAVGVDYKDDADSGLASNDTENVCPHERLNSDAAGSPPPVRILRLRDNLQLTSA